MTEQKRLGNLLLEAGIITQKQIDVALSVQKVKPQYLGEILQSLDFVTSKEIAEVVAKQQDLLYIDLDEVHIEPDALRLVPKEEALIRNLIPVRVSDEFLTVATTDATDKSSEAYLIQQTNRKIIYLICDKEELSSMIELHYYQLDNPIEKRIDNMITLKHEDVDIVELLNLIIHNAIKSRATDIHITPSSDIVHVSYRIDGVLKHSFAFGIELDPKIVSRVKILSNLDISEQRLPQDGGFIFNFLNQEYDLRVSTLPTSEGENLVLRILSRKTSLLGLNSLGLDAESLLAMQKVFSKPNGMVLVTGPTGSGKTTTLYSALREVDALSRNIITVEDPIEYRFSFVKQTQINAKTGYNFAKAIRHFMRQDPDVMLVGEIRDEETAKLAVRASITGHLVLSTLHANSALATIPRLLDMEIESDLLATSLHAVIAQRLVRKVCKECALSVSVEATSLGIDTNESVEIFKASEAGCPHCGHTGYNGRTVIIEILNIDEKLQALISDGASLLAMTNLAQESGFRTMREHALSKVIDGTTTLEEINRVTA